MATKDGLVDIISQRPVILVIRSLVSEGLCREIQDTAEASGFRSVGVKKADLRESSRPDLRNNSRADFFHHHTQELLEQLLLRDTKLPVFPSEIIGVSRNHRVYRYEAGQFFNFHNDMQEPVGDNATTQATVLIGLNDDYEGGETEFRNPQFGKVRLGVGDCLIFEQMPDIYDPATRHQGCELVRGRKYIFRTDLLKGRK